MSSPRPKPSNAIETERGHTYVLPSFPTPNGDLHVGHLSGPFVAADVLTRALRSSGRKARLLLGTVGYQSQVAAAARKSGRGFLEEADTNTAKIKSSLAAMLIRPDAFVEPRSTRYPEISRQILDRLLANGAVKSRTVPTHYCTSCDVPRVEAFLTGSCPHCGSRDTAGIECESCVLPYLEQDLQDAACAECGTETTLEGISRYVMDLEMYREWLRTHHGAATATPMLTSYLDKVLASPLPYFPVTVPSQEGISVHVEGSRFPSQVLYSGFELVGRMLTAIDDISHAEGKGTWEDLLASGADDELVILFGFDNAYLRGIVFPTVLESAELTLRAPTAYLTNAFYELDGTKFSTSRRHAIWGSAIARDHDPEWLRLYVSLTRPETSAANFTVAAFEQTTERLRSRWTTWLDRVVEHGRWAAGETSPYLVHRNEDMAHALDAAERRIQTLTSVRGFSPRLLAREAVALVDAMSEYAEDVSGGSPAISDEVRSIERKGCSLSALVLAPLMPDLASRIRNAIPPREPTPTVESHRIGAGA
jgi:methionyl-tRNA synthetase